MSEERFDVVVVGGGPAGTAAAIDLRRGGATVLLLERRRPGVGKPCAGALTMKTVRRLGFELKDVARSQESQVELHRRGRLVGRIRTRTPMAVMTVRAEFDELCRREAAAAGAEVRSMAATAIDEQSDHAMVRTRDGAAIRSLFVIGADGASSLVRRSMSGPEQRYAVAIEGCVAASAMPAPGPMLFDVAVRPGTYAWRFPKGDHVNVGLYSARGGATLGKTDLEDYARSTLGIERLDGVVGHALGVGAPRPWLGTRRVLLAGDAAGAAERLLGEGIHNAIAGGQSAAAAVLASMQTGCDVRSAYARKMRNVADDVALCDRLASLFYRWPRLGCAALSIPRVSAALAAGFAAGEPLRDIFDAGIARHPGASVIERCLGLKRFAGADVFDD